MTASIAQPLPTPAAARRTLLLLALAIFAARLAISIALGWNTFDEAWNLQVLNRFLAGDTLYRDIYFGVTPLPVYVAALFCLLFGVQAVVLKALSAAAFAGIFLATYHILRQAGSTVKPWPVALLLALIPISPYTAALYNDLSPLTLLLLAAATLAWQQRPTFPAALGLGVLLGICFLAKQNTGLYAFPVLAAVILLTPVAPLKRRITQLVALYLLAVVVIALGLLPILLKGGWHEMIVLCFTNKRNYIKYGSLNYFDGFRELAASARQFPNRRAIITFFWSLLFPLSILAPLAYAIALVRKPTRALLTVLPFLLVIAATIYPRPSTGALARAFPAMLIAFILAAPAFTRLVTRTFSAVTLTLAAAALALLLAAVPWRLFSRHYTFSTLPHTRGLLLHVDEHARLHRLTDTLKKQPQPIYILSAEAGCLYLLSGLPNPTRQDYPLINAYPAGEQEQLIADMNAGKIPAAAFQTYYHPSLRPPKITRHLTTHCTLTATQDGYQFFRTH